MVADFYLKHTRQTPYSLLAEAQPRLLHYLFSLPKYPNYGRNRGGILFKNLCCLKNQPLLEGRKGDYYEYRARISRITYLANGSVLRFTDTNFKKLPEQELSRSIFGAGRGDVFCLLNLVGLRFDKTRLVSFRFANSRSNIGPSDYSPICEVRGSGQKN